MCNPLRAGLGERVRINLRNALGLNYVLPSLQMPPKIGIDIGRLPNSQGKHHQKECEREESPKCQETPQTGTRVSRFHRVVSHGEYKSVITSKSFAKLSNGYAVSSLLYLLSNQIVASSAFVDATH